MTSRQRQQEKWPATDTERVIRRGHPTDREAIRRVAVGRIGQYRGSDNHQLRKYEEILRRIDAAILADAERHLEYLHICISRDTRLLEKAAERKSPFLAADAILESIAQHRARIFEIRLQQLSADSGSNERLPESSEARGATPESLPLALCPA